MRSPAEEVLPLMSPVTLPVRLEVMVPAEKFPDPSRLTIVLTVFALVAASVAAADVAIRERLTPQ